MRTNRVNEDEDVLELHVFVLVPVQQPEQLLHQLPLRLTGQRLDQVGELLEVQLSIPWPDHCYPVRVVYSGGSGGNPAYLESVLQKFQHIWTVSAWRSVWSPAKLRYQLGTPWNSLVSAWPIPALHSALLLTERSEKCKQSLLISNKCPTSRP